jgi:tRNA(Ile)-lysidine synthase
MTLPPRVAVAVSGGLDSTALLHCTGRLAAKLGVEVHALHVHHGLQPAADAWMAQVAAQCRRWRAGGAPVHFHGHRVSERPVAGDSVEAWARGVRYRSLAEMAIDNRCTLVLLAHHRQDQAETVLLQALRGAGAAGLSAMPGQARRQGLTWSRPWLDQPRQAIEAYARRWRLAYVQDPSNAEDRYARSRLRQRIWPGLTAAFPDADLALAAVARRAQEARALADEVAADDWAVLGSVEGLSVAGWLRLSPARRANLLRHWLGRQGLGAVPETLVQRLLAELPGKRTGAWPTGGLPLRLHAGVLALAADAVVPRFDPTPIDLSQPGRHSLSPWPGAMQVDLVTDGGLPAHLLQRAELRPRQGGEQFMAHGLGVARSLKKQFQGRQVAPWQRGGPLVWAYGRLVFVPALGADARALALPGWPRVHLQHQP